VEIKIEDLTKKYHNKIVVDHLNLTIPSQSVYGFIGPNGAGKTTTMRMMTGLLPPSSGKITFDGKQLNDLAAENTNIFGAFISTPSYYKNLTAFENLKMIQDILNGSLKEIDRVLELVNLQYAKNKKVSEFSFGMKQRLGLAFAFLNNPSILILDEPTNGLDPKGVFEIRELLRHLSKDEGKTIFISSHNITEIELISDYVGIINNGRKIFQGKLDELYQKRGITYLLETDNSNETIKVLQKKNVVFSFNERYFELQINKTKIPSLLLDLQSSNIKVYEITPDKNLERIFLNLTNTGGKMV
jgi:ABC-type multidrug transport system ATPase subunit